MYTLYLAFVYCGILPSSQYFEVQYLGILFVLDLCRDPVLFVL